MTWDPRGYYYRSVRDGHQIRREYFGKGSAAEQAAAEHACQRAKREAEVQAQRAECDRISAEQTSLIELSTEIDLLTSGVLVVGGYRRDANNQWRRKRHVKRSKQHGS